MTFYTIKNVYKDFGDVKVLKGIDLTLEEGQVLAIIGSSGSGKTTLLRCINFLEIPDKADIYLAGQKIFSIDNTKKDDVAGSQDSINADNQNTDDTTNNSLVQSEENQNDDTTDIKPAKKQKAKKYVEPKLDKATQRLITQNRIHFGMVFQSFNLFPHYNVLKNVTLAGKLQYKKSAPKGFKALSKEARQAKKQAYEEINNKAIALLERVGLGEKLSAYPCELSGGQQQRVAIARALILQPDILCFDEPTSALDPELTREVLKVIRDLKKDGHTMIVVTHEMEFAKRVADKVVFMADGIVEEQGTPDEVFNNPKSEKTRAFLQESVKGIDDED